MADIIRADNINKTFTSGNRLFGPSGPRVKALAGVSFRLEKNRCLGIAGESGSGKSTLARIIMKIMQQDSGEIFFEGRNTAGIHRKEYARLVQMVFQDPYNSLNPKLSVGNLLGEVLRVSDWELALSSKAVAEKSKYLLHSVGLPVNILNDYPHQFSGGQKQRIAIARSMALKPKVIIADEILSALDVSVQSQMLNLLFDLREKFGVSYIFITHDIAVMSYISDEVIILKEGIVVESGKNEKVLNNPDTEYTLNLIKSLPSIPAV